MATKKGSRQAATDAQHAKAHAKQATRETKAQLKELKKQGLYHGDLRKNPTRYAKSLIKKFSEVLGGRAAVVKTGSKAAKEYKEGYQTSRDKVIVPKVAGETFTFNKKTKRIESKYVMPGGERARSVIEPTRGKEPKPPKTKSGETVYYSIYFRQGKQIKRMFRTDDFGLLREFMAQYDSYKNWVNYVRLDIVEE